MPSSFDLAMNPPAAEPTPQAPARPPTSFDLAMNPPADPAAAGRERQLAEARRSESAAEPEPTEMFFARHSLPGASSVIGYADREMYNAARKRYEGGAPREHDFATIARFERTQKDQAEFQKGFGGELATAAAGLPAMLGEAAMGGAALRGAGLFARALPEGASIGARAGRAVGQVAATTPLMPSMYLERAAQNATEKGGEGYEPKNLAPALLHGALNVAVLGSLQKVANGVSPLVNRAVAKGGIGVLEQAGADVVAGATGLQTGYGVVGDIAQGRRGEALQHAVVQAMTFSAFAAIHGKPEESKKILDTAAQTLDQQARSGVAPDKAAEKVTADLPESPAAAAKEYAKAEPESGNVATPTPEKPLERPASDPLEHWTDRDVWDAATALGVLKSKGKIDRRKAMDALHQSGIPLEVLGQFTAKRNAPPAEERYAKPPETAQEAPQGVSEPAKPPEPTPTPESPSTPAVERRAADRPPQDLFDAVAAEHPDWTHERVGREAVRRLSTDTQTGLWSREKFGSDVKAGKVPPHTSLYDIPGLGAVNKFGDQAGDALIAAHGEAMRAAGIEFGYRKGGDELAAFFHSPEEQKAKGDAYEEFLRNMEVTWEDRTGATVRARGLGVARAEGSSFKEAQSRLNDAKEEATRKGYRSAHKGELPPSLTVVKTPRGGEAAGAEAQRQGRPDDQAAQRQGAPGGGFPGPAGAEPAPARGGNVATHPGAYVSPGGSPAERLTLPPRRPYTPGEEIPGTRRVTAVPRGQVREEARRVARIASDEEVTAHEAAYDRQFEATPYEKLPPILRQKADPVIERLVRETGAKAGDQRDLLRHAYLSRDGSGRNSVPEVLEYWNERLARYDAATAARRLSHEQERLAELEQNDEDARAIIAEAESLGAKALRRAHDRRAAAAAAAADPAAARQEDAGGAARPPGSRAGEVPGAEPQPGRGNDQPAAAVRGEAAGDRLKAAADAAKQWVAEWERSGPGSGVSADSLGPARDALRALGATRYGLDVGKGHIKYTPERYDVEPGRPMEPGDIGEVVRQGWKIDLGGEEPHVLLKPMLRPDAYAHRPRKGETRIGRVGDRVRFDPAEHDLEPGGGTKATGEIVRAGVRDADGNVLRKPLVRRHELQDEGAAFRAQKYQEEEAAYQESRQGVEPDEAVDFGATGKDVGDSGFGFGHNLPAPPPSGENQVGGVPSRGGPLGVRQANPQGEFALAREKVAQERELRNLPPVARAVARSNPVAWQQARERVAQNPRAGYELVDRLESDPQGVRPDDDVPLLLLHRVALSNAHDKAVGEYNQRAGQFGFQGGELRRTATEAELEPLRRRAEDLAAERNRTDEVTARVGTQLGRGLAYFRQLADADYNLQGMFGQARFAKGGQPLTPAETVGVVKAHQEVTRAGKALADAEGGNVATKDADLADLRIAVRKARRGWADTLADLKLSGSSRTQKVIAGAREGLNASRSLITSMDFSAVFRQGGFLALGHPVRAVRAMGEMFRAFASSKNFERQRDALDQRPNAELYKRSGLFLADVDGRPSAQEEAFVGRLARNIPGVAASERAYTSFLNRLRADTFDSMVAGLSRGGRPTTKEAQAVAGFVNTATGRGSLDTPVGSLEGSAATLANVFFSPRYVASRFQLLAGQPLWRGNVATRKLIAMEYARFAAGVGVFWGLALAADDKAKLTLDPRSSDFGKLRMGNTRIDPLTGLGQAVVFLSRVVTGEKKALSGKVEDLRGPRVPYRGDTTWDVATNFGRSKLAPVPGVAADVLVGKSVTGEKATAKREAGQLLVPMGLKDAAEALEDQGLPRGAAAGLAGLFGAGVQTFTPGKR